MVIDGVVLWDWHKGRVVWFRNRAEVRIVRWDDTHVWITTDGRASAPVDPSLLAWQHSGGW